MRLFKDRACVVAGKIFDIKLACRVSVACLHYFKKKMSTLALISPNVINGSSH